MASLPPPGYNPNASASSSGGFFAAAKDPRDALFAKSQPVIDLGNEYEAVQVYQVRRKHPLSREEQARANLMNCWWTPKGVKNVHFAQRCPFVSVDNFCLLYNEDMFLRNEAPRLILGVWDKEIVIFGKTTRVQGLVLAGGGHVERTGDKNWRPEYTGAIGAVMSSQNMKLESGDFDLRSAADKELSEEIGIDRKNSTIVTQQLACIDDVFADPRAHYVRTIYLRWIDQPPKPSDELKTVINVPISALEPLLNRTHQWVTNTGAHLSLELNHDKLIALILRLPATIEFINNMKSYFAAKQQQAAAAAVNNPMAALFGSGSSSMTT